MCTEMRHNLFVNLLTHKRNRYRRFLPTDIKYYLSYITKKSIKEFASMQRRALCECINFINFVWLD